ncbi:TetR-like C-terminal domain-containing protein [Loigolactobacillus iwatensis]|uniref:TetR-like C-terminal domain-containing protein n=1 Tax=Loigolactobacillus iwatensis TaxID=1267156 RepID=UPI001CDCBD76|nr:TetR-like C-terminal domain-containing protein [Loigolactobacillus iwatensis]
MNRLPKKDPDVISEAYFEYVDENSGLFETLVKSGAESILMARFTFYVDQFYLNNVRTISFEGDYARYWNSFLSAGLYNMTIQWIKDGRKAPIHLLAKLAVKVGG